MHVARRGHDPRPDRPVIVCLLERPRQIDPLQRQDDVGLAKGRRRGLGEEAPGRADVQGVASRERRRLLEVGDHAGPELLGERHARAPALGRAVAAADEDHRRRGAREEVRRAPDQLRRGTGRLGGPEPRRVRKRRQFAELRFLERRIEVHVGGAARGRHRHLRRAQQRVVGRGHGARLVVPLRVAADESALIGGGVDPVDPRAPTGGVPRPGRSQDQHRRPVAPGVEDRHAAVHQADVRMEHDAHHAPGDLRVPVRDRDGALLVQAQEHLGLPVPGVVHEAVVKPPEARPRVQRDVGQLERLQHAGDGVAPPDLLAGSRWQRRLGQDSRLHRGRGYTMPCSRKRRTSSGV